MLIAQHSNEFTNIHFDDNDWENLNELVSVLSSFYSATLTLSSSMYSTIGALHLTFCNIYNMKFRNNIGAQNNNDNVVNVAQQLDARAHLKSLVDKFRPTIQSVLKTARALLCLKSWITEKIGEDNNEVDQPDSDDDNGDDGDKENETNE
ncbi:uncharacterized protein OCT59_009202 [Rhizophagus irregularis]|uniref:uncharacterized protein n=1 Tax=Rhizophagus irregularis TaxID=588596 RepID=UPI00331F8AD2|nr:hypothetical protein OCT59_009202 [Rhizophagus irregularis]